MSVKSNYFVSVIAVINNDADILGDFIIDTSDILKKNYANYELLIIDNSSTDNTNVEIDKYLKEYECIRYIRLSRTYELNDAIMAGLDSAIGDVIIIMQPHSDPPSLIPEMVNKVYPEDKIIIGKNLSNHKDSFINRVYLSIIKLICKIFFKYQYPESFNYFIGMSRQSLNSILGTKDKANFIRSFGIHMGHKIEKFEYTPIERKKKSERLSLLKLMDTSFSIIVHNSIHPLKFISLVGFIASLGNLLYIFYIFLVNIIKQKVQEGWTTASFQNAIMFLFLFIILTILSEYIGYLIEEVQNRPSYHIREEKNSSVMVKDERVKNIVE